MTTRRRQIGAHAKDRPYEQIVIEDVQPSCDGGRHPVKGIIGDRFAVNATVFRHGHEKLRVVLRVRQPDGTALPDIPMRSVNPGLDRWSAEFPLDTLGRYRYTVAAWTDHFASWVYEFDKRVTAAQPDVASEIAEGLKIVEHALASGAEPKSPEVAALAERMRSAGADAAKVLAIASDPTSLAVMARLGAREDEAACAPELEVIVDRTRARFGAWYELFVRSQATEPGRPGTFADAARRLPEIRRMGFDVVYLAPIHPIGVSHRKGKNNSVTAGPDDPGSPWAIGSSAGGHMAIEPALGTIDDFDDFVSVARSLEMEVALDFAIQCSPDHPWVQAHPEWFYHRPDGTIRYAENPPKKYQDIYPVNFDTADWENLWNELKRVVQFWVGHGVKIFRVDNPHTKCIGFWTWLIEEIHRESPDVLFLAEAFTRPPMMQGLGKRGFSQSYTYFTWRNTKPELIEYMTELTAPSGALVFRPNFFANTPDILPPILQQGGPAAFKSRLVLAATLSPTYGIYSGYELCEHEAIPGREEYLNSEKYEIKPRDWHAPGNIIELITRVNAVRRDNPALQVLDNLRFLDVTSDQLLAYVKRTTDPDNAVIVVVNLDPFNAHAGTLRVPADALGLTPGATYEVYDALSERSYVWSESNYVRLDPFGGEPAHLFVVRKGGGR